jgi:predicted transcriptional regulator
MGQIVNIMDLRTRKYTAIEKIMHFDEKAMKKLEKTLDSVLDESISLEQYNKEIDEADAAIDRGEYIDHEDAVRKIKSWR